MVTIKLNLPKTKVISGYDFGKKIFNEQVKDKLDYKLSWWEFWAYISAVVGSSATCPANKTRSNQMSVLEKILERMKNMTDEEIVAATSSEKNYDCEPYFPEDEDIVFITSDGVDDYEYVMVDGVYILRKIKR